MTEGELDIADLLAEAENPAYRLTKTARILVGRAIALLDEHADLDRQLADAILTDGKTVGTMEHAPAAPGLAQQVADIEQRIEDAKTPFRFVSIGRRAWAGLVAAHPPTKDDLKRDARADINAETFPIAAIAASCASPSMTEADAKRLEEALPDSQWSVLWAACLEANLGGLATPKSQLAGSILRASERYATTAAPEASPDPGSLDE